MSISRSRFGRSLFGAAIVIGAGSEAPTFPEDRAGAVTLPVNALEKSLRPAIRHALRDRIMWRAA